MMVLMRYLAGLNAARTILWCYLIWYLTAVSLYFDPSPSLWLTSIGISAIVGCALWLSSVHSPTGRIKIGRWQLFRLFMAPFGVSSFSALIKGKGFLLVVFPTLRENAIALGGCGAFAAAAQLARRFSGPRRS
jgi:hypothetical protein